MGMLHAVQDRTSGCIRIRAGAWRNDAGRLNGLQRRLNFSRALVTLCGFLGEAALNNGPKAGRQGRTKRVRNFAHDG